MSQLRDDFVMVPNWLHSLVPVRCVGVYAGLRAFDMPGGQCDPTESEVAGLLAVSVSTVKRAVRALCAAKVIRLQGQRRGSRNTYTFPERRGQSFSKVPVGLLGQVPPATIGIYCVVRSFDGAQGCYPAINTVAARAGIGHTATQDALRALRGVGAIEAAARYKPGGAPTSNLYRFPDMIRQTGQPPGVCAMDSGDGNELVHQPGAGGVTSRTMVGSGGGRKPENLTREFKLEIVGRCPPPAVGQGLNEKSRTEAKDNGDESALAGNRAPGLLGDGSPAISENPWYYSPLDDPAVERMVWDLVDTLAEELALSGGNGAAVTTREAWARTARVMLVHDKRDYSKVYEIIRNACIDVSWSKAIHSMWDIARNWDRLVATFEKRAPKRFKPKGDKLVEEVGPPPRDYSESFGMTRLSDLPELEKKAKGLGTFSLLDL